MPRSWPGFCALLRPSSNRLVLEGPSLLLRRAHPAAPAVVIAAITAGILATRTGPGEPPALAALIWELSISAPPALLWMAMAFGIGWPLRALLVRQTELSRPLQL